MPYNTVLQAIYGSDFFEGWLPHAPEGHNQSQNPAYKLARQNGMNHDNFILDLSPKKFPTEQDWRSSLVAGDQRRNASGISRPAKKPHMFGTRATRNQCLG